MRAISEMPEMKNLKPITDKDLENMQERIEDTGEPFKYIFNSVTVARLIAEIRRLKATGARHPI